MPHNVPNDTDRTTDHSTTESESSSAPNYYRIDPPADRQPSEYSYVQRRAEILDFVVAAGGPTGVENTRLAERYDVNRSTIKRDLDALSEFVNSLLEDGEDVLFRTLALHDRVIADLLNDDDWRASKAAYDVHRDFADWAGVQPGGGTGSTDKGTVNTHSYLDDDSPGFLSERNRAHFERLTAQAAEATAPNTVSPDDHDDSPADDQDSTTDSAGK